ncbi:hypothetical protein QPM17_22550 [Marinobacter sp. TBZ242]|uniref:Transmembrane anchor protein n=1 Tax=Marinobacter azerbaijanicus TaxID=3050455 RepID=A0ABT7IIB7_9GAMM|nr:hypothetical protein [Marinobacter sp. TBZ242]MDL0433925.1 hypothetical protein [Marinobacter sp. TBZ242]
MYNTDLPTRAELPTTGKLIRSTLVAAVVAVALLVTVVLPAEYAIDPTGAGRLLGLTEMGEIKLQLVEEAELDRAATQAATDEASPTVAEQQAQTSAENQAAADASLETTTEQPATASTSSGAADPVASSEPAQDESQPEAGQSIADATSTQEQAPEANGSATWRDEVSFALAPGEGTEYKLTMEEGAIARFAWISEGGPLNFDTHGDGNGNSISYEKGRGVPEDEGELEAAFTGNHGWFFRNRNDNEVTVVLRIDGDYGELKRML